MGAAWPGMNFRNPTRRRMSAKLDAEKCQISAALDSGLGDVWQMTPEC